MKTQWLSKSTALLLTWTLVQPVVPMAFADMDPLKLSANQINSQALPSERVNLDQLCEHFLNLPKDNALHKGKSLKAQCEAFTWSEDAELQTKCKLRDVAMNSQAQTYCKARKASKAAKNSLKASLALDVAAGGICMAEAYSFPFPPMGLCGGAALAAGMNELARVVSQYSSGGSTAGGGYKVDAEGNVDKRPNNGPLSVVTNVIPTLASLQIAKRFYSCTKDEDISRKTERMKESPQKDKEIIAKFNQKRRGLQEQIRRSRPTGFAAMGSWHSEGGKQLVSTKALEDRLDDLQKNTPCSRRIQAFNAGLFFIGLAAVRGMNYANADKTVKAVEESLRAVTGESTATAAGAITNSGNMGVTKNPAEYYNSGAEMAGVSATDIEENSPEAMLMKNSQLGAKAQEVANRFGLGDDTKLTNALSENGGATGLAAGVASAMGGPKGEILSSISDIQPYIAQVDTSGSTYGMGGGGSSAGSAASSATPLDFGKLLGGEEGGGGMSAGVTEEAFRAPAKVKSIFHEDTDQNLFQIVSGRLENLQNQARIPAHIVR